MEMIDIMHELADSRAALVILNGQMRKLRGKCLRKNLVIAGLVWFGATACKLLGETDKKRQEAEKRNRELEAELARGELGKDICCDGKASIDKKEV